MTFRDEDLTATMVQALRSAEGLNLEDEAACMRALRLSGLFSYTEIVTRIDKVRAEAMHRKLKLSGVIADAAGATLAIVGFYFADCVVCPPGSF